MIRLRAAAPYSHAETVWVGDAVPGGAVVSGDNEGWTWVRLDPEPVFRAW